MGDSVQSVAQHTPRLSLLEEKQQQMRDRIQSRSPRREKTRQSNFVAVIQSVSAGSLTPPRQAKSMRMAECHPNRKYFAKGLCKNCYRKASDARHRAKVFAALTPEEQARREAQPKRKRRRYGPVTSQLRYARKKAKEKKLAAREAKRAEKAAKKKAWRALCDRRAAIRLEKAQSQATKEAKRLELLAQAPPTKRERAEAEIFNDGFAKGYAEGLRIGRETAAHST